MSEAPLRGVVCRGGRHDRLHDARAASELEALRAQRYETKRATVPALEDLLYTPVTVLDHGFVRVVDYMGDDGAIVQRRASRMDAAPGAGRTTEG